MEGSSSLVAQRSVRYDPGMRLALKLHPDSRCAAVTALEVEIARPQMSELVLRYYVSGKMRDLSLPSKAISARKDALWQQTCFEAFVQDPGSDGYCELNFSPSTEWAAYCFSGYRAGMRVAREIADPEIELKKSDDRLELQVSTMLPGLSAGTPWRLGLCAVIEEASGRKSYWALTHPAGKPDFHHADCFVCEAAGA
jgi:hypothetical protein